VIINTYIKRPVNGMGLGDFIRGSMALYQVCAEREIPFKMDFSQHPAGAYLTGHESLSYEKPQKILDLIDVYEDELRNYEVLWNKIEPFYKTGNPLRTYCNAWQTFPLSNDCSNYMKNSMIPNNLLQEKIRSICHPSFNHECYETIHIRTGDPVAYGGGLKRSNIEKLYDEIGGTIRQIRKTSKQQIIVLSDSTVIKNLIAKKFSLYRTSSVTTHLTVGDGDVAATLADYFILLHSKKIYQFTNAYHWWGSGFSNSASWIYDVPIQKYKLKCFKMEFQRQHQKHLYKSKVL